MEMSGSLLDLSVLTPENKPGTIWIRGPTGRAPEPVWMLKRRERALPGLILQFFSCLVHRFISITKI
jgi:hypothetical protein